ncbi:Wzz/FepE/Etk N-terminal domain-containing protein [Chloroflexus sp.]|uniref:Wzz/FepE/Etk N-terminal domain-containing protein n=1 Tax=Chloroflexus sp. TaxID=1904827 RepID=UPI002ACEA54C|nr:Wzz/FepE/Etk N-terminal domain-containing protein [Chloroflexus sp.]
MNDEIDLKPYLQALLRRWWVVIGVSVGMAVIVGVIAVLRKPPYTASSSLLIVPASSQITLDNRFTSRDSLLFTTTTNQREALLGLVKDPTLAERVANTLHASGVVSTDMGGSVLVDQITVGTDGDLVKITVHADRSDHAHQIAEVWAQEYARLVAETYTRDTTSLDLVQQQLVEAQERYRTAQATVEAFIAKGELTEAEQTVRRLSDIVNSARSAGTDRFASYLRRANDLEQLLRDAQLLRARLAGQPNADGNTADAVAALLLRIRNLSDRGNDRPILQIDSSLTNRATVTLTELDQLIEVLDTEYRAVRTEVERLSQLQPEELSPEISQQLYAQLAEAQTRLEQLYGQQRELTRDRDTAFELIQVLLRRINELQVANAAPQVTVRYLGTVNNPPAIFGRQVLTQAAIAALAGIVLSAMVIAALEAIAIARRTPSPQSKPTGD